jgi:hypothetical protein
LTSRRFDLLCHTVGALLVVLEGQCHVGAVLGEPQRHSGAYATAAPGDEGHLPVEYVIHT